MKTLKIFAILITTLILAGCLNAQQSEPLTITLNVPFQLKDIHPDVSAVVIKATAFDAANKVVGSTEETSYSGSGDCMLTKQVLIHQAKGKDITRAVRYECKFFLKINGVLCLPSPKAPVNYRPKEGTPFTQKVSGKVIWN